MVRVGRVASDGFGIRRCFIGLRIPDTLRFFEHPPKPLDKAASIEGTMKCGGDQE